MLSLTLGPRSDARLEVLCVGAHCDDIEIGCGGTLISLQKRYPDCRIHWLVLTSGAARRAEAEASAKAFVRAPARGEVRICDLHDGLLPAHLTEVKGQFEDLKAAISPDLIFTHQGSDRHQDHSLVSHVTWQTFRDHMIWEYEIPKYDGDLSTPTMYVPLTASQAARKVELITRLFASQRGKSWFTAENLEAAMRIRGLESRSASGLAEAFHCRKLIFGGYSDSAARARPLAPRRQRAG